MYGPETEGEARLEFARNLGMRLGNPVGPREPAHHWVEASGAGPALASAITATRMQGRIVMPAMYGRLPEVDLNQVVRKGLSIHGSYGYTREDYSGGAAMVSEFRGTLERMVSLFRWTKAWKR
ncbi:threonine dehydrogenase-like Zn-dependent dehydrogenase [Arthrobacter sp. UYEF36]